MNRLGSILLQTKKISEDQLDRALQAQAGTQQLLGDVLVNLGYLSQDEVAQALAAQFKIPYLDLGEDFKMEQEEVTLVPEAVARRYCILPVRKNDNPVVTIVMRDPLDAEAVDTIRSLTKLEVHKAVSTERRILAAIDKFYRADAYIERSLHDLAAQGDEEEAGVVTETPVDSDQLRVQANDAPVIRFVNLLLMQAVRDRASDIHFEPEEKDVRVRLRVDGVLHEVTPPPKSIYPAIVTRIKILSHMDIAERRLPLDGRFKFQVHGHTVDIRVSTLPEVFGEKAVLRVLDRDTLRVDMREIGFEEDMEMSFKRVLNAPYGIALVTGPTGSGKTTTLYSALYYLRSPEKNIQTVEDPVEYLIKGIDQMQVKPGIGLDFADALRSILRQDPDIIMVGEIRDSETARIAMRAALTGHLVLSTLHTNDAPSAFVRLRDIGIEPYLIASTVNMVLSQRLVRAICAHCKQRTTASDEMLRVTTRFFPDAAGWEYDRGAGCEHCGESGYRGRTAIFEYLENTSPVREMIVAGTGEVEFRRRAIALGMEPLHINGLKKVRSGVTTVEEVLGETPIEELA